MTAVGNGGVRTAFRSRAVRFTGAALGIAGLSVAASLVTTRYSSKAPSPPANAEAQVQAGVGCTPLASRIVEDSVTGRLGIYHPYQDTYFRVATRAVMAKNSEAFDSCKTPELLAFLAQAKGASSSKYAGVDFAKMRSESAEEAMIIINMDENVRETLKPITSYTVGEESSFIIDLHSLPAVDGKAVPLPSVEGWDYRLAIISNIGGREFRTFFPASLSAETGGKVGFYVTVNVKREETAYFAKDENNWLAGIINPKGDQNSNFIIARVDTAVAMNPAKKTTAPEAGGKGLEQDPITGEIRRRRNASNKVTQPDSTPIPEKKKIDGDSIF